MSPQQNRRFTAVGVACLLGAAACGGDVPTSTPEKALPPLLAAGRAEGHHVVGSLSCPNGTLAVENAESANLLFANSTSGYIVLFAQDPATGDILFEKKGREPANKTIVECTFVDFATGRILTLRGFFTPAS